MQTSIGFQPDSKAVLIAAVGGEPIAGSGFESEEPELDFSNDQTEGEE